LYNILYFVAGAIFGAIVVFIVHRRSKALSDSVIQQSRIDLENSFKAITLDLSKQSRDELSKLSEQILDAKMSKNAATLEEKKKLIDQSLSSMATDMKERMEKVQKLMDSIGQTVPEKYGEVSSAIEQIAKQSESLRTTTESLNVALSGAQSRGQWGERMAEDILNNVGLQENINYTKQKTIEGGRSRPDFTFFLPNDLKINMDVKFPWTKYRAYLDSSGDAEREQNKKDFLNSVKERIKEASSRDYINPEENTVDYVLVFIPNEQVYRFIEEIDYTIVEDALKKKVILCSPLTLYAMLALIRQALDNFNLQQSSRKIQALLGGFSKQWGKFIESMKTVGDRIDQSRKAFDDMIGKRTRQLDRQVKQIDQLNKADGIKPEIAEDNVELFEIEDNNED
jgi:DNA recombination protein RmuC